MRHSLLRDIDVRTLIAAGALAVPTNGADIDTRGFGSSAIVAIPTAVGGPNGLFKLQESDTGGGAGYTDVAAAQVLAPNGFTIAAAGYRNFAYLGTKRYYRLVATPDTSMNLTAVVVQGEPLIAPVNPAIA